MDDHKIQGYLYYFRFLISNTDHIIDVNKATTAHQHDQINIVCPQYKPETPKEVKQYKGKQTENFMNNFCDRLWRDTLSIMLRKKSMIHAEF